MPQKGRMRFDWDHDDTTSTTFIALDKIHRINRIQSKVVPWFTLLILSNTTLLSSVLVVSSW